MFQFIKRYFQIFNHCLAIRSLADAFTSLAERPSFHDVDSDNSHKDARLVSQIRTSERWQTANLDRICLGRGVGRW